MGHLLDQMPEGARIAVIRLRSLGDCVLTTPALALLKSHRPDLEVGVVVEDRLRAVFEGNPDVDAILAPAIAGLLRWRPRLALNLHGGTRSMMLTAASGAAIRTGFGHHSFSWIYSARIPRAQNILGEERPVHTAEHLASAMFWLGVPAVPVPAARLFVRGGAGLRPAAAFEAAQAVIHPFASAPEKTWPAEQFLAIAEYLRAGGLDPVFLAGESDDDSAFTGYRILRGASLEEVKNVLATAQLFIGNDSGPAHMAAAFGVPVVALFGPSNPATWSPWRTESRVLTAPESIGQITVEQVKAAAWALLGGRVSA